MASTLKRGAPVIVTTKDRANSGRSGNILAPAGEHGYLVELDPLSPGGQRYHIVTPHVRQRCETM